MKKILVPTDFSTCANNAVNFVVQTAKFLPVEITLLHSFEISDSSYMNYVGLDKEYKRTLLNDLHVKLAEYQKTIKETEGVTVDIQLSVTPLLESILKVTEEKNIDLIVMGTLGATGLKEKLWGSKTADLIDETKVPVMVIPHEYEWKKPGKFLLAINNFEEDPEVLNPLFKMAQAYQARMEIATFIEDDAKNSTHIEEARKVWQYEGRLKEQYKDDTLTVTHILGTEFEETLQLYIKEKKVDVLSMITYQQEKNFLQRLFTHSFTKRMSYHTTIPLLAIPAK